MRQRSHGEAGRWSRRHPLVHADDGGIDEWCRLRLGYRLGRRSTNTLAGMLHSGLAAILLSRLSQRLLRVVRRVLGVRWRVRARRRRLLRSGRGRGYIDFDVGDRVAFDIVRVEAVAACRKEHWTKQSAQRRVKVRRHENAPSCRVKVAFCGLTAATTPCTSVFGGFCRVTMTEIPMKPDAMAAGGIRRELCEFWL